MKIKFKSDFRGRETNEQFYKAGEIVEVEIGQAEKLIKNGFADEVLVLIQKPVAVVDEKPAVTPAKKGHKK